MDKIRAIVDGKEVFGWYYEDDVDGKGSKPFILPCHHKLKLWADAIQIDISTAAVATGRKDKNGVEIFGSKGEMRGGDRVSVRKGKPYKVAWCDYRLTWVLVGRPMEEELHKCHYPDELEIIPKASEEGGCPCGSGVIIGVCPECKNEIGRIL